MLTKLRCLKLLLVFFTLIIVRCNTISSELQPHCERFKVYYNAKIDCHIFVLRNKAYAYFIFENDGKFYYKAEKALNSGDLLYYGKSFPSMSAALYAAEVGNKGEYLDETDWLKKLKTICD